MNAVAARVSDSELRSWQGALGRQSVRIENRQSAVRALAGKASNDFASNRSELSHLPSSLQECAPSQRPQHGVENEQMSFGQKHRNVGVPRTATLHEVKSDLNSAIQRAIPKHRVTAKEVAHKIGVSENTVDNLRRDVPDAMARLVMLGQAFPDFRAEVARLMGMERDLDPEFQRQFVELLRRAL